MPKKIDGNEQALVAVLCEVGELGVDLSKLAEKVRAGIMDNKQYTWVDGSK